MTKSSSAGSEVHQVPFLALVPFLLITFLVTWGIVGLYVLLPDRMTATFGQLTGNHPLFFLAVYGPAIAACLIVVRRGGFGGLVLYLKRLSLWRCSRAWAAFLLIGLPLVFYVGSAWKGSLFADPFPFASLQSLLIALLLGLIKGPVEEIGWRGLALPLLQRKCAPIWASLILGLVWGIWHLPAFVLSGTQQSAWSFTPFVVGTVAISVIMTSLYNASGGSILLASFMHFQLMNPIWPDAQPYDTYILVGVGALVVLLDRRVMFGGDGALTAIIPRAEP